MKEIKISMCIGEEETILCEYVCGNVALECRLLDDGTDPIPVLHHVPSGCKIYQFDQGFHIDEARKCAEKLSKLDAMNRPCEFGKSPKLTDDESSEILKILDEAEDDENT